MSWRENQTTIAELLIPNCKHGVEISLRNAELKYRVSNKTNSRTPEAKGWKEENERIEKKTRGEKHNNLTPEFLGDGKENTKEY